MAPSCRLYIVVSITGAKIRTFFDICNRWRWNFFEKYLRVEVELAAISRVNKGERVDKYGVFTYFFGSG